MHLLPILSFGCGKKFFKNFFLVFTVSEVMINGLQMKDVLMASDKFEDFSFFYLFRVISEDSFVVFSDEENSKLVTKSGNGFENKAQLSGMK